MPSTCNFEFDRPQRIFYSGETIKGRIVLTTTSEKTVREVYILFEGEAKVIWCESKSRSSSLNYYSVQKYLHSRTNVFPEGTLPPGTHIYTFNITLPEECPTSCYEKFGNIKYQVILVINRIHRFDNVFTQHVTIIRQLNLNLQPHLLLPLQNEDLKCFCFWPCTSEPVCSVLSIPFGGYVPGQNIKYKLEINNKSSYDLEDSVELRLMRTYLFIAKHPKGKTRTLAKLLAKSTAPMCCLRLTKCVIEGSLTIPPIPPTSMDGIIQLSYYIQMIINTGCCHSNSAIKMPITIGSIPLAQTVIDTNHGLELLPTTSGSYDSPVGDRPSSYDHYRPHSLEDAPDSLQPLRDTEPPTRHAKQPLIRQQAMEQSTSVDWNY